MKVSSEKYTHDQICSGFLKVRDNGVESGSFVFYLKFKSLRVKEAFLFPILCQDDLGIHTRLQDNLKLAYLYYNRQNLNSSSSAFRLFAMIANEKIIIATY